MQRVINKRERDKAKERERERERECHRERENLESQMEAAIKLLQIDLFMERFPRRV